MKRAAHPTVKAKRLKNVNSQRMKFSQSSERTPAIEVQKSRANFWTEENKAALDSYSEYVDEHGVFSDGLRRF